MAWDKVGVGRLGSGVAYVIERHVIHFHVPRSTSVLPIRLRSYRWRLATAGGTWRVQDRANSREQIDAAVDSYRRRGVTP